jgi:tetratricopeptide (TPR) repeat protein
MTLDRRGALSPLNRRFNCSIAVLMLRRVRLLTCICLLAVAPLCAKHSPSRIELYHGIAEGNYLIGDLTGAAKGIDEILKIDPDYLPALTLQARVQLDQGNAAAALAAAEQAIRIAPEELQHQLLKALVLGNLKRHPEAIALIEQVIARADAGSDDARAAQQLLGLLRMAEGDWDAAAETFNQVYLAAPEHAASSRQLATEAYLEQARRARSNGTPADAVSALSEALAMYEGESGQESLHARSTLRMLRARALTQLGQLDAAIEDLQVITGQQPDNLEALVTLASLYASAERWQSLQGLLTPLAAQPHLQDIALYLEGRAALAKGRAGTARAKFEAALDLLPDGPSRLRASLHFYRGWCLDQLGRHNEGSVEIRKALDADFRPETGDEAILASRTLLGAKKIQRAITLLEAITLNRASPSAEAWSLLGRAHLADDATALALSALTQSLSIQPAQADTLALRGALLRKLGDLEGAAADTENALLLDPGNPALTYTLGLIRLQQGDLAAAEQRIGLSASRLPENPGIQLLHALLAYNCAAPKTAGAALHHYLELVPTKANESAYFLEYALGAANDRSLAILKLSQRTAATDASPALQNFLAYVQGELERKAVLDDAGRAETPEIAQQQLCEAAYWLAQHERLQDDAHAAAELLQLAIQIGSPDMPEFQFATWQLIKR